MAGHEKYFNTTIRGISGVFPDYAFIMIGSNMGISGMTKEHIIICIIRQIPIIVLFTKVDIAPTHILEKNIKLLIKMMKGVNKSCVICNDISDIL